MQITILKYQLSRRTKVQAFVDILIDDWLCIRGIHFQRDHTLNSPLLTPLYRGERLFIPAVEILDAGRGAAIHTAILAAIDAHLATLPEDKRVLPVMEPKPPKPKPAPPPQTAKQQPPAAKAPKPTEAKPPAKPAPATGVPIKTLLPPLRPTVSKTAPAR